MLKFSVFSLFLRVLFLTHQDILLWIHKFLQKKKKIINLIYTVIYTTGEFNFVKDIKSDFERFSQILKDEVKWKIVVAKV